MSFVLPASLNGPISDREAVTDALFRAVLAFDHADEELLRSAVTDDVMVKIPGTTTNGISELKTAIFDHVSKLDTTHFLSNVRVHFASPTEAKATCSAMAQHIRTSQGVQPDSPKLMTGGFDRFDVVKVGELWKLKSWEAQLIWSNGDLSILASE